MHNHYAASKEDELISSLGLPKTQWESKRLILQTAGFRLQLLQ